MELQDLLVVFNSEDPKTVEKGLFELARIVRTDYGMQVLRGVEFERDESNLLLPFKGSASLGRGTDLITDIEKKLRDYKEAPADEPVLDEHGDVEMEDEEVDDAGDDSSSDEGSEDDEEAEELVDTQEKALQAQDLDKTSLESNTPSCELLEMYLKASPALAEFFDIWDSEMRSETASVAAAHLEALSAILRVKKNKLSSMICRRILKEKFSSLFRELTSQDSIALTQAVLRLFISIALQSPVLARDLQRRFDVSNKNVRRLPFRRPSKSNNQTRIDIRGNFVRLVCAFLQSRVSELQRDLLAPKNLAGLVLQGLSDDSSQMVNFVTHILYKDVLENRSLPVKLKAEFFNSFLLDQYAKLLEAGQDFAVTAKQLIVEVCLFSPYVFEKTDESALAPHNAYQIRVLTRLLTTLQGPEDLSQREIIIGILTKFPALIAHYFRDMSYTLEPKLSYRWMANYAHLLRVMDIKVTPDCWKFIAFGPERKQLAASERSLLNFMVLPPNLTKREFARGLQHANALVFSTTLDILIKTLLRSAECIKVLESESIVYGESCRQLLKQRLPDAQTLVAAQTKYLSAYVASLENPEASPEVLTRDELLYCKVLTAIRLLFSVVPSAVAEARLDLSKLLPPMSVFSSFSSTAQSRTLELILVSGTERLDWLVVGQQKQPGESPLQAMLSLLLQTEDESVYRLTIQSLTATMVSTGVFQSLNEETGAWLTHISKDTVPFFVGALTTLAKDPFGVVSALREMTRPNISSLLSPLYLLSIQLVLEKEWGSLASRTKIALDEVRKICNKQAAALYLSKIGMDIANRSPQHGSVLQKFMEDLSLDPHGTFPEKALFHLLQYCRIRSNNYKVEGREKEVEEEEEAESVSLDALKKDGSESQLVVSLLESKAVLQWHRLVETEAEANEGENSSSSEPALLSALRECFSFWTSSSLFDNGEVIRLLVECMPGRLDYRPVKKAKLSPAVANSVRKFLQSLPLMTVLRHLLRPSASFQNDLFGNSRAVKFFKTEICAKISSLEAKEVLPVARQLIGFLASSLDEVEAHTSQLAITLPSMWLRHLQNQAAMFGLEAEVLRLVLEQGTLVKVCFESDSTASRPAFEKCRRKDLVPTLLSVWLVGTARSSLHADKQGISLLKQQMIHLLQQPASARQSSADSTAVVIPVLTTVTFSFPLEEVADVLEVLLAHVSLRNKYEPALFRLLSLIPRDEPLNSSIYSLMVSNFAYFIDYSVKSRSPILLRLLLQALVTAFNSRNALHSSLTHADPAAYITEELLERLSSFLFQVESSSDLDDAALITYELIYQCIISSAFLRLLFLQAVFARRNILPHFTLCWLVPLIEICLEALGLAEQGDINQEVLWIQSSLHWSMFRELGWRIVTATLQLPPVEIKATLSGALTSDRNAVLRSHRRTLSRFIHSCSLDPAKVLESLQTFMQTGIETDRSGTKKPQVVEQTFLWTESIADMVENLMDYVDSVANVDRIVCANMRSWYIVRLLQQSVRCARDSIENEWIEKYLSRVLRSKEYVSLEDCTSKTERKLLGLASKKWISWTLRRKLDCALPMELVKQLLVMFYGNDSDAEGQWSVVVDATSVQTLEEIHEMVVSHSLFQGLVEDRTEEKMEITESVLQLVLYTLQRSPDVAEQTLFKFFLCAYQGSLSKADRLLKKIIQIYDERLDGIHSKYRYVFGPGCKRLFSDSSSIQQGFDLCEWVFSKDGVDGDKIKASLRKFPFHIGPESHDSALPIDVMDVSGEEGEEESSTSADSLGEDSGEEEGVAGEVVKDDDNEEEERQMNEESHPASQRVDPIIFTEADYSSVYDPSHILRLLQTVATEHNVSIRKFAESGMLGYAVMAMSSLHADIRELGYGIVAVLHEKVTNEKLDFRERPQLFLLLETLRAGIRERCQRLSPVTAAFVASSSMVLLRPGDALYPQINSFLLQRPNLDVSDVPMFYNLFYSGNPTYRIERTWLLKVFERGFLSTAEYSFLQRRRVLNILMGFFQSPLADDEQTQLLIISLVKRIIQGPVLAQRLIDANGFLTWCCQVLQSPLTSAVAIQLCDCIALLLTNSLKTRSAEQVSEKFEGVFVAVVERIQNLPSAAEHCPQLLSCLQLLSNLCQTCKPTMGSRTLSIADLCALTKRIESISEETAEKARSLLLSIIGSSRTSCLIETEEEESNFVEIMRWVMDDLLTRDRQHDCWAESTRMSLWWCYRVCESRPTLRPPHRLHEESGVLLTMLRLFLQLSAWCSDNMTTLRWNAGADAYIALTKLFHLLSSHRLANVIEANEQFGEKGRVSSEIVERLITLLPKTASTESLLLDQRLQLHQICDLASVFYRQVAQEQPPSHFIHMLSMAGVRHRLGQLSATHTDPQIKNVMDLVAKCSS